MTSISILSSAIECLNMETKGWGSLSGDATKLVGDLESVKILLGEAYQRTKRGEDFVRLEKQTVTLTYDIIDAASDNLLRPSSNMRGRLANMARLGPEKKSRNTGFHHLENTLKYLKMKLEELLKNPESENFEEKENVAAPEQESDQANPASTEEDLRQMEEQVRAPLLEKSEKFSVVCIQGKSGMGKSTLAKKVFYHDEIRRSFEAFAWVPINQNLQTKKVLQALLQQLDPHQKGFIRHMNEIRLIERIFNVLKWKKCLILLDDICAVEDWQSIRVALPTGTSSKIFITTPSQEVADGAAHKEAIFKLPRLSEEECFQMLKEKASFNDAELQSVGKTIHNISEGSPLIALILGKSLKTKDPTAGNQVVSECDHYKSRKGEPQVLGACYERLAHELKPCLLYLGPFPQGEDVEVQRLYLLLMAEDLISPEDSRSMQTEGNIFKRLAGKKLVEVQEGKVSKIGMNDSCRLLEPVREFSISQGLHEEFFEIADFANEKKISTRTRRLAIYMSKYKDGKSIQFLSQDTMKKIRSLLIFGAYESEAQSTWPSEINDLKEFSHLRVLDFDGVDFRVREVPRGIDKIVFLRYLSFRGCWLKIFPSSVSKLPCLETLDLRVHDECKMTISNIISNMKKLRHLYFPKLYESDGKSKLQLQGLESLEILVNFDTDACKIEDIFRLKKLQILTTISGHQKDLEIIKVYLEDPATKLQHSSLHIRKFDRYTSERVAALEKLLQCTSLKSILIEGRIGEFLKDVVTISENFTEIVLNGSELEHDPMTKLADIKELRSLVLSNDAFIGEGMLISAAHKFCNLRSLKFLNLMYLEKLTIEEGALPKLSTLVIENCDWLEELKIPETLHDRLQKAQVQNEGDVYSVLPLPPKVDIISGSATSD